MTQIDDIKIKANRLSDVRKLISAIEDEAKTKKEALEEEKAILQEELIAEFNEIGISSIKADTGETYSKATKKGIEITNEAHAIAWARENYAFKIDLRLAAQKLKDLKGVDFPAGFERKETEYISVRKPKDDLSINSEE